MADNFVVCAFNNSLQTEMKDFKVDEQNIKAAIKNLKQVYLPNPSSLDSDSTSVADFNCPAHRCAYLHKYGAFHTALVRDMMSKALEEVDSLRNTMLTANPFKVCSLGGRPGSDVFGILACTDDIFPVYATIIDLMVHWTASFGRIKNELSKGPYGNFGIKATDQYFDWNYIAANLLLPMTNEVHTAIDDADLVTMVKFISAAACTFSDELIQNVFCAMKPGAFLLFIDNAAGGFHQILTKSAKIYRFRTVFGPLKHYNYTNEVYNRKRFNYVSCFSTTVTVHLLQKPLSGHEQALGTLVANAVLLDITSHRLNSNDANIHVINQNQIANQNRQSRQENLRNNRKSRSSSRRRLKNRRHSNEDISCDRCCIIS